MNFNIIVLLRLLINQVGVFVLVGLLLSRFVFFKKIISSRSDTLERTIKLIVIFSVFAIISTYNGIPLKGAFANSRVVPVFVSGLLGGPLAGLVVSVIAGVHRFLIDPQAFTSLSCMLATIGAGILSGMLHNNFIKHKRKWLFGLIGGLAAELIQIIFTLAIARPFDRVLDLIVVIALPMALANALGVSMLIALVEWIMGEEDRIGAEHSRTVLQIAYRTLPFFRKGLNSTTAEEVGKIIIEMTDMEGAAFYNTTELLAFSGTKRNTPELQKHLLELKNAEKNSDPYTLKIDLQIKQESVGTIILCKSLHNTISRVDKEIARGLGRLFSSQIELSLIDEQAKLIDRAELETLQAQINPHFLFNALNTIVSFVRRDPEKARNLILQLASHLRKSLAPPERTTLADEIENIENYLEIEKARFGDNLEVTIDIPDVLLKTEIPLFIIQPLVENAFKHGLFPKCEKGKIVITGAFDSAFILLTISDNGVGIEKEKQKMLLDNSCPSRAIGLKNVHQRLKHIFGNEYGLEIESEAGKGTNVYVRLPGGGR